jgi:hypothetical protein
MQRSGDASQHGTSVEHWAPWVDTHVEGTSQKHVGVELLLPQSTRSSVKTFVA